MSQVKPTGFLHTITPEIQQTLEANPKTLAIWDTLTPLAKNEWICWITIPKQQVTRDHHLVRLIEQLNSGERRPCCWPGCPHRRPQTAKWFSKPNVKK